MADYGGPSGPSSVDRGYYERLKAEPTICLPFPLSGSSRLLVTRPGILAGFSIVSGGAAAAACRLWDGDANTGQLLASIEMAINAGETSGPGVDGPLFKIGLYLEVVAGTLEGGIWVKI